MLEECYQLRGNYVSNNKSEQSVSGASDNRNLFDKTYSTSCANVCSETTMLEDCCQLMGTYVSNNKSEQSGNRNVFDKTYSISYANESNNKREKCVSGASNNRNFFDKTYSISYANVCSENTLLNDSSNILTAYQKLSTEATPKSKPKTKLNLPPQNKGSLPLTVYHQNI